MDSGHEDDDSISRATYTVGKVFKEVQEEFRLWKQDYASRTLQAVACPPAPSTEDAAYDHEKLDSLPSEPTSIPPSPSPTPEYIEILDYETGTTERVPMQVFRVADTFSALPAYEYCTPTVRNIFQGDDPHDMPFVPFADDPTFNHARYLEEYRSFSWRTSALDPDCEVFP
jgi:histone-lysine N-methyltransferase EZH2